MRELIRERGLPAVIVNPSAPVGPHDARPTPTGRMVLEAARGRMPAYVDTGLNLVHVDDVAAGHLLAFERGRIGERYILGGQDLTLGAILALIAGLTGRRPPSAPPAGGGAAAGRAGRRGLARLRRAGEPLVTVDGVRMARKPMYFSSAKAARELGYRARPAEAALADAIAWYRARGDLR